VRPLLEADRCAGIHPVSIKSEDQQALVALHRVCSQWVATRTARINAMRALLREFGIAVPTGSKRFLDHLHPLLADRKDRLPPRVHRTLLALWEEARGFHVVLLPPHYVKPYRRRSKTDRSDCEALQAPVAKPIARF
jgi:transposase